MIMLINVVEMYRLGVGEKFFRFSCILKSRFFIVFDGKIVMIVGIFLSFKEY